MNWKIQKSRIDPFLMVFALLVTAQVLFPSVLKADTLQREVAKSPAEIEAAKEQASYGRQVYPMYTPGKGAAVFYQKVARKIARFIPRNAIPGKPTSVSVRIFMDNKGNVKKVIPRGTSGSNELDMALVKASYEASPLGELPRSLKKEAKKRGIIIKLNFGG